MTSEQIEEKRGGRPVERDEPKRAAIAVRTTPAIKERLQAAAAERGRSITQEVEARIEESFEAQDLLGGVETRQAFSAVAAQIKRMQDATGKHWLADVATHAAVRILADRIFASLEPRPENAVELDAAWKAYEQAQITAYARARILEKGGLLYRPMPNALAAFSMSPRRGDERNPDDALAHAGTFAPTASIMADALHGEKNRDVVAAVQYFGLNLSVGLAKPIEDWEFPNKEPPPTIEERQGLAYLLSGLVEDVREAVRLREEFARLYQPLLDARASGRAIATSGAYNAA